MKVKEESEKAGLKLNIQKTKSMTSSLITSWQIDGWKMATVADFIFLGSKITAGDDCSHEIKRCLLLGRKAMTNIDHILKSRDITLATKVHIVKPQMCKWCHPNGFSSGHVWIWELDYKEGSEPKNWCFQIMVLKKTLESPLDSKETNQSILKESSPEYSWEGLMLKLKFQCFGHLIQRWFIGKDPDDGKDWRQGEKGMAEGEMLVWHHQHDAHEFE